MSTARRPTAGAAQTVGLDVAVGLQAADSPPYGGTLGVARLLRAGDDAGEAGGRGGRRGAVDVAAAAGLAAYVRQHGPLHPPGSS